MCTTKQECLECEVECWSDEVILSAIHLIWVLFTYRVRHYHLVVHLYACILRVLARHIYVTIEEYYEVRSNLVNVRWVLSYDRDIICYVNWHRRHQLVATVNAWYLIFDFIVKVVQPLTITRIASAVDDNHWDFHVPTLLWVLKVLQYARTLAKHTRDNNLCLFTILICTAYSNAWKDIFEKQVRGSKFSIKWLKFHT